MVRVRLESDGSHWHVLAKNSLVGRYAGAVLLERQLNEFRRTENADEVHVRQLPVDDVGPGF
jgi:hypothetical protein